MSPIPSAINLVLPENEVHLASSSIDGQLVLNLRSTLVDPVVKVELKGRGFLRCLEEDNPELDYNKILPSTKTRTLPKVHTSDFHFSFPPRIPSTFTSKIGCISYFFVHVVFGYHPISSNKNSPCFAFLLTLSMQALLVMEARKDAVYFCCFGHVSVILWMSLEESYVRKVIFAVHCVVLYSGFSSKGEQCCLKDQSEVMKLESQTDTAHFEAMRVTSSLVLLKAMNVTSILIESKIMAFRY
uniref:Uncharacterized protein n=1 Tax=Falco tinnunculus TaxID=100819 RepID=A0A8C4UD33_FALTI